MGLKKQATEDARNASIHSLKGPHAHVDGRAMKQ